MRRTHPDPAALLPSHAHLLGTILPSANTVVERVTVAALRGLPVAPLFTRVPKRGAVDPCPDRHDTAALLAAAELLADARPGAVLVSAGKGAAIGLDHDRALVAAIAARTGIPADTPGLALLRALRALGLARVALIGPHGSDYNRRVARGLAAEGIETVAEAGLGIGDNLAFAAVGPGGIAALARRVAAAPGVQAIIPWNTNCAAAPLAAAMEAELGLPWLEATALGLWGGLATLGVAARPGPALCAAGRRVSPPTATRPEDRAMLPGGMPTATRDLAGPGPHAPRRPWPGEARLALSLVVNVEEGAELSLASGDERNEATYEAREEVEGHPDPCMESHFAYGSRAGLPRILDLLDAFGAKATFSACGRAVAATPALAASPAARGHEVSAHGWRWERHAGMPEATERAVIAGAVRAIATAAGERPVGWHTRSAASVNTRRLLLEEGGFLYDSDAYDDDMPRMVARPDGGRHVILPYAFDTNDMRFAPGGGFVQPEDFARYCISALDWLLREGRTATRMLSIGLHLRIIGRPARMPGLEAVLEHVARTPGIWVARRRDIAAHWLAGEAG